MITSKLSQEDTPGTQNIQTQHLLETSLEQPQVLLSKAQNPLWGVAFFSNGKRGAQDTVLDTPMNNYAVLETGSNGNLVATADGTNLTYVGEAGTDYYYEADGVGAVHTGGDPFSSTDGVTYNFGQQPFVETPTAEGRLYQTWEQWARTALGYALDRITKLEQQRASDLETIAELRTQVESALARIGSIESDEVNDDAVDTVLLATVADLITRVEALEAE